MKPTNCDSDYSKWGDGGELSGDNEDLDTNLLTAALHFLTRSWENGFRTEMLSKPTLSTCHLTQVSKEKGTGAVGIAIEI